MFPLVWIFPNTQRNPQAECAETCLAPGSSPAAHDLDHADGGGIQVPTWSGNYKNLNLWNLQNIFLHAVISFLFTYLAQMICQNPKRTLQQWLAVSSKGTPEQKLIFNVFINWKSWPYHDRGASWRCRALKFSRSFQQILLLHSCHIAIASRKTKRGSQILLLLSLAMFAAPTVCSW